MKLVFGIIIGFTLALGLQFAKTYQFHHLFVPPVESDLCDEWKNNYYWQVERWHFDSNWKCSKGFNQ